jgi:hypothetical protein
MCQHACDERGAKHKVVLQSHRTVKPQRMAVQVHIPSLSSKSGLHVALLPNPDAHPEHLTQTRSVAGCVVHNLSSMLQACARHSLPSSLIPRRGVAAHRSTWCDDNPLSAAVWLIKLMDPARGICLCCRKAAQGTMLPLDDAMSLAGAAGIRCKPLSRPSTNNQGGSFLDALPQKRLLTEAPDPS